MQPCCPRVRHIATVQQAQHRQKPEKCVPPVALKLPRNSPPRTHRNSLRKISISQVIRPMSAGGVTCFPAGEFTCHPSLYCPSATISLLWICRIKAYGRNHTAQAVWQDVVSTSSREAKDLPPTSKTTNWDTPTPAVSMAGICACSGTTRYGLHRDSLRERECELSDSLRVCAALCF